MIIVSSPTFSLALAFYININAAAFVKLILAWYIYLPLTFNLLMLCI